RERCGGWSTRWPLARLMTNDQAPMTNEDSGPWSSRLGHSSFLFSLRIGEIDVERGFAVEITDDLTGIDVESALEFVGRGIGVELLNADFVFPGRDILNLEL